MLESEDELLEVSLGFEALVKVFSSFKMAHMHLFIARVIFKAVKHKFELNLTVAEA